MAGLCSLPDELIISEILHRLPASSLVRFKCINKHWLKSISDPTFAASHLACQTPGRVESVDFGATFRFIDAKEAYHVNLASVVNEQFVSPQNSTSNGLLLVATVSPREKRFYIVNPVVRRCMKLPSPLGNCDLGFLHFDDDDDRYMVLAWTWTQNRSLFDIHPNLDQNIYVLVIQNHNHHPNNVWQEFSPPKGLALLWYPVAFKGWFYWITNRDSSNPFNTNWGILAFNPEIGFREIKMTSTEKGTTLDACKLFAADECLYLVQSYVDTYLDGGIVRKRICFYAVSRYEDDLEERSVNTIYNGEVQNHTDSQQCPWEFRFACTSLEAEKIIDSRQQIVHTNSLVWEFSC